MCFSIAQSAIFDLVIEKMIAFCANYTIIEIIFFKLIAGKGHSTVRDLTQGNITSILLRFAIPIVFSRVFQLCYNLADTRIVSRQTLQSLGDQITPVISSGIECVGKVIIAFTLARQIGYLGIILAEPIVWFIMVIPLLISLKKRMPPAK